MRAPRTIDLRHPFTGRWAVQNSPANRVPSHGTSAFASSHAIDFVPVDERGRTAPITASTLVRPERADRFPGFGRSILAPVDGIVHATLDDLPDHDAYRGVPSIAYALGQARRARGGWRALAGNHVLIEVGGALVALCHVQQHSIMVRPGERVRAGEPIARCGNSGNSTEPHVHVQAVDDAHIETARAVAITFEGTLPRNGAVIDVPRRR